MRLEPYLAAPKPLAIFLAHLSTVLRLELGLAGFSFAAILIDGLALAVLREGRRLLIGT